MSFLVHCSLQNTYLYILLHSLVNICFVSTLRQMKILFKFELNLTTVFVLIYSSAHTSQKSFGWCLLIFTQKRDKNKHFHSIVVVIYGNTSLSDAPTFLALFDKVKK